MVPLITAVVTAALMGGISYALTAQTGERLTKLEKLNSQLRAENRALEGRLGAVSSVSEELPDPGSETPEHGSGAIDLDSAVSKDAKNDRPGEIDSPSAKPAEKAVGYIKNVYLANGKRYLEIDYIQLLTGEEAAKHRIATGDCKGSIPECMPDNDYLLVNQNKKIRKFEIAATATITAETPGTSDADGTIGERAISFDELKGYFDQGDTAKAVTPYRIMVEDGSVTRIAEVYFP